MTKTRARKRGRTSSHSQQAHQETTYTQGKTTAQTGRGKKTQNPRTKAAENLFMPSLVALGCWGLAFSFIFLTSDTNHYLYGGMAVVMAVMWTVMVIMRVNKMRQVRQNVNS